MLQQSFLMTNIAYTLYLCISIGMTIWVARVLSESGKMFLIKCFGQDEELAQSTNRLLVIGFYLVNIGFICTRLDGGGDLRARFDSRCWLQGRVVGADVGRHALFNMFMIAKFGKTVSSWTQRASEQPLAKNSINPPAATQST